MNRTIRIACIFAGVIAALTLLPADREKESPEPLPSSPPLEQIEFYHFYSGTLSGGISEMVDQVNRSQGRYNISAKALDHEAFKSMIHTTLRKGTPPELFSYWAGARVQYLVDKGKLHPIDDFWKKEQLDRRFQPSIIKAACTYNGKKYLLPIAQHLVVFFYNTRLFNDNGLLPPKTWPAFLEVCQTLKTQGVIPLALGARERWPAQFWMDYLLLRNCTTRFRDGLMTGKVPYTHPDVETIYQTWAGLIQKGYFNPDAGQLDWAEAVRLICQGRAAMTLMGTWAIPLLKDKASWKNALSGFDFFAFPRVNPDIPKVALGPVDGIVLSGNSANHEFAKAVLAYFARQKPQEMFSQGSGALAPSLDVPLSFYSPFRKRIIAEIKSAKEWAFNYDLATPPQIAETGLNSFLELLEFPGQSRRILENLESEAAGLFTELNRRKREQ